MLKLIIQGMAVGIANIIPGVSGGTMMVAMGLYDKLIHCITHFRRELKKSLQLLIPIFAGAGIAILVLSRIFTYLLEREPIPTNLAFCGLIVGSLPYIVKKVKGHPVTVGKLIPFLAFFALVVGMALLGEGSGAAGDVSLSFGNVLKLFGVGIVAAATMVIPGVSGSMMLMLLGYYDVILSTINSGVDALLSRNLGELFRVIGILLPFGVGIIVGIFAIAEMIEWIFKKAEIHAYYGIIGLIAASPIAILLQTDWSGLSLSNLLIGSGTFLLGWVVSGKLGGE